MYTWEYEKNPDQNISHIYTKEIIHIKPNKTNSRRLKILTQE